MLVEMHGAYLCIAHESSESDLGSRRWRRIRSEASCYLSGLSGGICTCALLQKLSRAGVAGLTSDTSGSTQAYGTE